MMNEKMLVRPTFWKASNGPLFIKSVWMDHGNYRHFILDHDLPKKRTFQALRKSQPIRKITCRVIEDEFENLQLVGSSEIGLHKRNTDRIKQDSTTLCRQKLCKKPVKNRINLETLKKQLHENIANKNNPERVQKLAETTTTVENSTILTNNNDEEKSTIETPAIGITTPQQVNDTTKNQLTERVLNWLDLAGKNTLIKTELSNTIEKIVPKRRILTTESIAIKPPRTTLTPLRRAESVHHLSLTLNEDELDLYNNRNFFEASSRCASAVKFGEFFPATYRCSRKFLAASSYRHRMAAQTTTFPNVSTTENGSQNLPKIVGETEKKKKYGKYGRMDSAQIRIMENQYKSMIHRQILENSCNRQIAKRQLHIFMPNLPHKKNASHAPDCDSCLSSTIAVSDGSKI